MKSLISIACALLLLGCSNDTQTGATATPTTPSSTVIEENVSADAPTAAAPTETAVAPVEKPTPAIPAASTPAVQPAAATASVDGGALYSQKCASCHGAKAEKAALNKSQIIANFDEGQIKEALKGYQAGTYGKEMKALMQGQAKGLNDAQIDALAKHVSAF